MHTIHSILLINFLFLVSAGECGIGIPTQQARFTQELTLLSIIIITTCSTEADRLATVVPMPAPRSFVEKVR